MLRFSVVFSKRNATAFDSLPNLEQREKKKKKTMDRDVRPCKLFRPRPHYALYPPRVMAIRYTTPEENFENGGFTLKALQMFSVHTMPEEFENGGFTLKTHQMLFVHTTPEEFENTTITGHSGFVFD